MKVVLYTVDPELRRALTSCSAGGVMRSPCWRAPTPHWRRNAAQGCSLILLDVDGPDDGGWHFAGGCGKSYLLLCAPFWP